MQDRLQKTVKTILITWFLGYFGLVSGQSCPKLIINEVSNGPSGTKEYIEFLVIGCPGGTQDIRGLIVDDNSGRGATCGAGMGIAAGHYRFTNNAQWASVPVGSLIVIYDNSDPNVLVPVNDPTDSNLDRVYIIPISNTTYFVGNTTNPSTTACNNYTIAGVSTTWAPIGLANTNDIVQIVDPANTAVMMYSVGYGFGAVNLPGTDIYFNTGGTATVFSFMNTVNNDAYNQANWASSAVAGNETPGVGNSVDNTAFINAIRNFPALFTWDGDQNDGNWLNCRNWDLMMTPCPYNNVLIPTTVGAATRLNLATVPTIILNNVTFNTTLGMTNAMIGGTVFTVGQGGAAGPYTGVLRLQNGVVATEMNTAEVSVVNSATNGVQLHNALSYINGRLRRSLLGAAGNYDFPMGDAINYELATIQQVVNGGTGNLVASFRNGASGGITAYSELGYNFNSTFSYGAGQGFWRITPNAGAMNYNVVINPVGFGVVGTNYTVVKRNDGSAGAFGQIVGSSFVAPGTNSAQIRRDNCTGFSEFTAAGAVISLPVEAIVLRGKEVGGDVILNWEMVGEQNDGFFRVERSLNGVDFEEIGIVKVWSFDDLLGNSEKRFYRIRYTDLNGDEIVSNVIEINILNSNNSGLSIYPNPSLDGRVWVEIDSRLRGNDVKVRVLDLMGREVRLLRVARNDVSGGVELDLGELVSGVYVVEVGGRRGVVVRE